MDARLLVTPAEQDEALALMGRVWMPRWPQHRVVERLRRGLVDDPGFLGLHGIFADGTLAGAVGLYRRRLCCGPGTLDVALLRRLCVDESHRRQGLGSTLLAEAVAFAREQRLALVLVNAAPGFFGQRGFVDIHDPHQVVVDYATARRLPPRVDRLRPARLDEAPLLGRLYAEQFAGRVGAPWRDLPEVRRRLAARLPDQPPMLAVNESGEVRGYLAWPQMGWNAQPEEVVALDAEAARDLLMSHAHRCGLWGGTDVLRWTVPPDSPTVAAVAAAAPCRTEVLARDNEGPMAAVADAAVLLEQLTPALRQRWEASHGVPGGSFGLAVNGARLGLELAPGSCQPRPDGPAVTLAPADLARLVFGFVEPETCGLTEPAWPVLFPHNSAWMPDLALL